MYHIVFEKICGIWIFHLSGSVFIYPQTCLLLATPSANTHTHHKCLAHSMCVSSQFVNVNIHSFRVPFTVKYRNAAHSSTINTKSQDHQHVLFSCIKRYTSRLCRWQDELVRWDGGGRILVREEGPCGVIALQTTKTHFMSIKKYCILL